METKDIILLVANILSLIGNALFTLSSIFKKKRNILLMQSSNYILAIIAEYLQKAYSGMVQEGVSLIRNIILLFVRTKNKIVKLVITITCVSVAVTVGIIINYKSNDNVWYGYLPIMGTIIYSSGVIISFMIEMREIKSELIIKIALGLNSIVWALYGFFIQLYPILIFNIITLVLVIISIIRISIVLKKEKLELKEEVE